MDLLQAWSAGHHHTHLDALRAAGKARFREVGVPTTADEAWHYTSVKRWIDRPWRHAEGVAAVGAEDWRLAADVEIVLVDGRLRPEASRGLDRVAPIADAAVGDLEGDVDGFAALAQAFVQDGVLVRVGRGEALTVHLVHVGSGDATVAHPRHRIEVARHGALTVVETFTGRGANLTSPTVEVDVADGASVHHVVHHADGQEEGRIWRGRVRVGRDARYRHAVVVTGGQLVRHDLRVTLVAPGGEAEVVGAWLPGSGEHVDCRTVIDHATPNGTSRQRFRAVVASGGRGVFDGTVIVRKDAQKTDAAQSSDNLLLAEDADANARPRLEIYADDVKCSHGTTVGRLDRLQLSYLRTRGIPEVQARQILTRAFLAEALKGLPELARSRVEAAVDDKLASLQGEVL